MNENEKVKAKVNQLTASFRQFNGSANLFTKRLNGLASRAPEHVLSDELDALTREIATTLSTNVAHIIRTIGELRKEVGLEEADNAA